MQIGVSRRLAPILSPHIFWFLSFVTFIWPLKSQVLTKIQSKGWYKFKSNDFLDLLNFSKLIFYTFSWPSHPENCISLGSFIGFVLVISKLYVTNVFNIPIILLLLSTFPANKPHSIFVQRKNIIQNILRRNLELWKRKCLCFTLLLCLCVLLSFIVSEYEPWSL